MTIEVGGETPGLRRTAEGGESARDLAECAREPIHAPGAIQPHGLLLAVDVRSHRIVLASANASALLGIGATALLGRALDDVVDVPSLAIPDAPVNPTLESKNPVRVQVQGRAFDAIMHRSESRLLLELEPASLQDDASHVLRETWTRMHRALARLRSAETESDLFEIAAVEIRALTGFDRVMVYRFERDGHGEVVAEAKRDDLEPFLGLHYPASDIPEQARRLYTLNPLRLIPDAQYTPSPVVPPLDPETGAPLDLTWAVLRSVSPVHLEYLANMGVRASMSLSLLERDSLWGLISCHHQTPHFVPYGTRVVCELFGQVLAWHRSLLADRERERARSGASLTRMRIVRRMSSEGIASGAMHGAPNVKDLVPSGGVALWTEGSCTTLGAAPPPARIDELARWLRSGNAGGGVFDTDRLSRLTNLGAGIEDVAAGLLAVTFSGAEEHVLMWFRPEVVQRVRWGGDVRQKVMRLDGRIGPRRSFAEWVEQVRGTSLPWLETEVEQVEELRASILGIVMRTAAELARLNDELRQALRSRDEFLSMASHELRTPLSTLELQLEVLTRLAQAAPGMTLGEERVARSLAMSRRQLTRLEQLLSEMLDLSRISAGRLELGPVDGVDLHAIVREVLQRFADRLEGVHVDVRASGDTAGCWDASRLDQVVTNLLTNAIKYGDEKPITISLRGDHAGVELAVRDHGVGLSPEDRAQLFTRFHRVRCHERRYAGFGLGLWIVKQLVEAHGGSVGVESELGRGATFRVRLPRRSSPCRIGTEGIS